MRSPLRFLTLTLLSFGISGSALAGTVRLSTVEGSVSVRGPKAKSYAPARGGMELANGARVRTAKGAKAELSYPDGSKSVVRSASEVVVRARSGESPGGVTLFFGRVWSKVTKSAGGASGFEVRSANAVAGVRGTEFEVGVGLDGSTRVLVKKGEVGVAGEGADARVHGGQLVDASNEGDLSQVSKSPKKADWDGWFAKCAKNMHKRGLAVARALDGRLNKRKAKLRRLLSEQKQLKKRVIQLEKKKKMGAPVGAELAQTFKKLERVTARIESMYARLQGAFGLFDRWKAEAAGGRMKNGPAVSALCRDVEKVAQQFADMIEEGTDLSIEGMDEMMDDMGDGKRMDDMKPSGSADDMFK